MCLAHKFAQDLNAVANKVWLLRCCVAHFKGCLAREHQYAKGSCVVSHLNIGVDAVAHHRHLVGLVAEAGKDARKHIWVWLAECNVGTATRSVRQALAD